MVSLTLWETDTTANKTKKLPKLDASTILHLPIKIPDKTPPKRPDPKMIKATPRLAPEDMPKTKGPASGFLKRVCINNPEIPKPEPTITAVIALGNLNSDMITCQVSLSLNPNKLIQTSFNGMATEPKLIFVKKHMIKMTINPTNERRYVFAGLLKSFKEMRCVIFQ